MQTATDHEIDIPAFRQCLGQFPTGVCIVTCSVDDKKLGMTMSSFSSLSLNPPLVLFSISRSAKSLALWKTAENYALNILAETQRDLSNRFARAGINKWEGIPSHQGLMGAPLLTGTCGVIECSAFAQHDGGDHILFIAHVDNFQVQNDRYPLVFCKSCYGSLHTTNETAAIWPLDIHYF